MTFSGTQLNGKFYTHNPGYPIINFYENDKVSL